MSPILLLIWQAASAPIVRVHVDARIELEHPRRIGDEVVVSGHLVDDETGEPLSGPVTLELFEVGGAPWPHHAGALSAGDGGFTVKLRLPPVPMRIVAHFAGDSEAGPARAEQTVDLGQRPLELRIEGPARVRRGQRATFRVMALSDGLPADVQLRMAGAPLRLRDGATEVSLTAAGRGPQKLEVDYPGGLDFDAAHAEARYVVEVPVELSLELRSPAGLRRGETLELAGTIADADGPLALASVDIRALGQSIAVAQADANGAFTAAVGTRSLPAGRLEVDALYHPTASWHGETRSRPLAIQLADPEPPPLAVFALPALLTALGALGWRLLRSRRPAERPVEPAIVEPPARGLRTAVARTRRSIDRAFDGVVLDLRTGRPVEAAELLIDGAPIALDGGRFTVEPAPGRHEVLVRATGYLDERFSIELPHRGELRGVAVHLCPIRLRVLEEFRAAIGDPEGFDQHTPRELAEGAAAPLRELAGLVEDTNYSGREVSPADADRARQLRERS